MTPVQKMDFVNSQALAGDGVDRLEFDLSLMVPDLTTTVRIGKIPYRRGICSLEIIF